MALRVVGATADDNRVLRNTAALAAAGVTAQLLFLTCEALIARYLGAEAYGVFGSVHALTLILCFVIEFGMNWKLVEDGSREPTTLGPVLGTMLAMALVSFAIVYPATLWMLDVFAYDKRAVGFYAIFAFFGLCLVLQDLLAGVYAALGRMEVTAIFQAAMSAAILGGIVILLDELTLDHAGTVFVAGGLIVTAVWAAVTFRRVRPVLEPSRVLPILKGSYLYGITGLLINVHLRIGVLVLATFQDAKAVAVFAAAHRLITLGVKVPVLVTHVIAPKLFAEMAHRPGKFRSSSDVLMRVAATISVVMAIGVLTAAHIAIQLVYGKSYSAAGQLLQILGVSLALKTFAQIGQTVITAADDHTYRTRVIGFVTLLGTILAIPLSIRWGPVGAAAAAVLADLVWSLLMLVRLAPHLSGSTASSIVGMPLLSAGLAAGLAFLMPAGSLVAIVVCPSVALGILWLSGYLRPVFAALPLGAGSRLR